MLDVIGVWTFHMRNAFGQSITVDACIIDGCTDEFLVGVEFFEQHKAVLDFDKHEVRYGEKKERVVIPFRTDGEVGSVRVAAVRLAARTRLGRSAVAVVEVAVAAPDGEEGLFVPTVACGAVMMATTLTRSRNGKVLVPVINGQSGRVKLPGKKELGKWIPVEKDMEVLTMSGAIDRDKLDE